jgi:hypothetical protein
MPSVSATGPAKARRSSVLRPLRPYAATDGLCDVSVNPDCCPQPRGVFAHDATRLVDLPP